ncbi:MAG: hypothetical protein IKH77_04805 [Clostridia bacterium]|nr:hypothetical protein [Clostridia bacterium]
MPQNKHYTLNEHGQITVRNLSAFWLPEMTVREDIHGTTYIVTGSYEGQEPFTQKLERIMTREFTDENIGSVKNNTEPEE